MQIIYFLQSLHETFLKFFQYFHLWNGRNRRNAVSINVLCVQTGTVTSQLHFNQKWMMDRLLNSLGKTQLSYLYCCIVSSGTCNWRPGIKIIPNISFTLELLKCKRLYKHHILRIEFIPEEHSTIWCDVKNMCVHAVFDLLMAQLMYFTYFVSLLYQDLEVWFGRSTKLATSSDVYVEHTGRSDHFADLNKLLGG